MITSTARVMDCWFLSWANCPDPMVALRHEISAIALKKNRPALLTSEWAKAYLKIRRTIWELILK